MSASDTEFHLKGRVAACRPIVECLSATPVRPRLAERVDLRLDAPHPDSSGDYPPHPSSPVCASDRSGGICPPCPTRGSGENKGERRERDKTTAHGQRAAATGGGARRGGGGATLDETPDRLPLPPTVMPSLRGYPEAVDTECPTSSSSGASFGEQKKRPMAPPPGPACWQWEAIQVRRGSWPPIKSTRWNFPARIMPSS
jgi:hypothetical protein